MKYIGSGLLFFLTGLLLAQAPGGVPDPLIWSQLVTGSDGTHQWREHGTLQPDWPRATHGIETLNEHPAIRLTGAGRVVALPQRDWSQLTIASVYATRDLQRESLVWFLQTAADQNWLLTTRRAADLTKRDYLNFGSARINRVGLHTYYHNFGPDQSLRQPATLYWGRKPRGPQLPIEAFHGLLPELIVYDRVLAPRDRARLESYLALKYGLTLGLESTPLNYLDARGRVIWSGADNAVFHHAVTGLGRDVASGWRQLRSASAYDPELLRIGLEQPISSDATSAKLTDGSFLVWGHNAAPIASQTNERGLPAYSARHWRVVRTGNADALPSTLRIDPRQLSRELGPEDTYWLLIDRAGAEFGKGPIDYIPLAGMEDNRFARFRDFHWDTDGNGRDAFALAIGPALLATIQVQAPTCDGARTGGLSVGAIGGKAPYRYSLSATDAAFAESWTGDARVRNWTGLPAGEYRISVTDAAGASYRTRVFLQATEAPAIDLERSYSLPEGGPLVLELPASAAEYQWMGPAGFAATGSRVSLSDPGPYRLSAVKDACPAWYRFEVTAPLPSVFTHVALAPNPVLRRGSIQLEVYLAKANNLNVRVLDTAGKVLFDQRFPAADFFRQSYTLPVSGSYSLQLIADGQVFSRQLLVQ